VLVAGLNILGIRVVGKLTLVLLLLQMLPVAAFVYLGFTHAHFNPFHPWMPPGRPWREVYGVGLALALWIYSGYEQLSTVIEEVEHPTRNFPRGLAIVVPVAAVVFFLPMAGGLAALGNWKEWQTAYLVTAGRLLGGASMEWAMFCGAAICAFVLLDATVLSVSRVPFTMAEDGYLHSSLARLHPRFGTPVRAIVISTLFCSLLALGSVTQLIAIYAWMRSATSILTLLSLWRLRRVAPEMKRSFVVPGGKAGLAAVVVIPTVLFAWALINSDPASRLWGIACLALGIAKGAYEASLGYSKERYQFDKPIASFQAISFKLADMATEIEAADLLTLQACDLKNRKQSVTKEAAMAKYYSSEIAEKVASKAIEVFGGVGVTKDYPVEKLYRDAKIGRIYEGTSNIQLMTIAKKLLEK